MSMQRDSQALVGLVVTDSIVYTLHEFCCACTAQEELIIALVEEGIVEPVAQDDADDLHFSGSSLARARTALRLQRELEINLSGVALALDLMDEVQALRRRLLRLGITDV
jgi:chaperone modulatory protein CbpM